MASEDEIRRLILEVVGEDKVQALRTQLDLETKSLLEISREIPRLVVEEKKQDDMVQMQTVHLAQMNNEMVRASGHQKNFGYAALEASRAIEDLQYGLGGVINNIPGLVLALGGSAGLTAAISLVAVGVNQLVKHYFPEWTHQQGQAKEGTDKLTQAMKDQKEALEALEKAKPKAEGVEGVIGANREEMRKALADQIRAEAETDIAALPRAERRFGPPVIEATPQTQARLAFAQRRIAGAQLRADEILGRAVQGGLPEQFRLRQLFGPETEIGARLAEAGPDREEQRRLDEQQVEQQRRMHRLDEQIARQKEQAAEKRGQLMGQSFDQEEQDLHRQQQADQHAAQQKRQADQREVEAKHKAASAAEQKARKAERKFIEDVRLKADVAAARGVPAEAIGMQAAAMFERMARTNGRTTDLAQAQVRMMLHLQQLQERQERQNQEIERNIQRFWANGFRTGK